ncbi:MAG: diaminopimelate epimerase [Gemmatimonadaceae bacterium]
MSPDAPQTTSELFHKLEGIPFTKMTGSGNDFVVFDSRAVNGALVTEPEVIRAICNRHNGIGADGVVLLEPNGHSANVQIHYYNSDGSAADLCGNATLCSTAIAVELAIGDRSGLTLWTDAGLIKGRIRGGSPEIDLAPATDVRIDAGFALKPGEQRIGYAVAGVPHAVVLVDDVERVSLMTRGAELRYHEAFGKGGTNVNFVHSNADGSWRYRTYERGVEGETLACGTGSVATAVLLSTWGLAQSPIRVRTTSQRLLTVTLRQNSTGADFQPSLRGEGRIIFRGQIQQISSPN